MEMTNVSSSNISQIGYDPSNRSLHVKFLNGGLYEYTNVPPEVYQNLRSASSVGSYFHQAIKGEYPATKIG